MGYAERLVGHAPGLTPGLGEPASRAGPDLTWLAHREPRLWLLTLVGLVADVVPTVYGLGVGLSEANPLVVAAAALGPLPGLLLLKLVSLALGSTWLTAAAPNTVHIAAL